MIFQEHTQPNNAGYTYDVEDVFGAIHIVSNIKLDGELLDDLVVLLLKQNISAEEVRGEVKHSKGVVQYVFKKRPAWEDGDDEPEPCENTPTLTQKQDNGSTPKRHLLAGILNWLKLFVAAFQEAWRKTKNQP